jgi:hypothetical protein
MTDLEAISAIQRTAAEYCRLYDDGSIDELVDIFSEGAKLTYRVQGKLLDREVHGREDIRSYYKLLVSHFPYYAASEVPQPPSS